MSKNKIRQGNVSIELVIGIVLSVVVLFVALGLFNDNLSDIVLNSNLKNIFYGNTRTEFTSFNRNYSDSQVDIQVTGEQGLEVLRRKANNMAKQLIENPFSTLNENANDISYLALVIKSLSGEPHICVFMEKNSVKHCNEDSIGGYSYRVNINGPILVINRVNTAGNSILQTVSLNIGSSSFSAFLSNALSQINSDQISNLNATEIYEFIANFSEVSTPYIKPTTILMQKSRAFKSSKINRNSIIDIVNDFRDLFTRLSDSLISAHEGCTLYGVLSNYDYDVSIPFPFTPTGCTNPTRHGLAEGSNIGFVSLSEIDDFNLKVNNLPSTLNASSGSNASESVALFLRSNDFSRMIEILKNDHKNDPTSCDIFKSGLKNIATKYELSISIPECTPNDT